MRLLSYIVVTVVVLGHLFEAVPPPCRKCPVQVRCCSAKACSMRMGKVRHCGMGTPVSSLAGSPRKLVLPIELGDAPPVDVASDSTEPRALPTSDGFPRSEDQPPRSFLVTACAIHASNGKGCPSMNFRVVTILLLALACAPSLFASCGSSSCPLDTHMLNLAPKGGFALDLSFQYIDQDQPRIGSRKAHVGEIEGEHHDEVRTLNRIATALLSYAPTDRLHLSVSVPYVSRDHFHLASTHQHALGVRPDHNILPEYWDLNGVGDVVLQARAEVLPIDPVTRSGLWVIGGVKLPTGKHDVRNDDGEVGELPVQPGTGTTDGIVGLSWQGGIVRQSGASGPMGGFAVVPYFVSATYQLRTGETDGYRLGNELQVNAGGGYPLGHRLDALLQVNSRFRSKDDIEEEPEEEGLTGGTYVYASPGLRFSIGDRAAIYAIVQVPLYQHVNGIQLTSSANYVAGLQTRF
jgi:hypothetical protein